MVVVVLQTIPRPEKVRALGTVQKDAEEALTPPADTTLISALSPLQCKAWWLNMKQN